MPALNKIEWLVADVTANGAPDRAEHMYYFRSDFGWALFWPFQATFVVGEPLWDVTTRLEP